MTNLTKKAKIALGSAGAGVLALAVALGIWQPWEKEPEQTEEPPVQQETQKPAEKPEKGLTLTVGGEEIACTLFEGDGWQIYVPKEWVVDANETGGAFRSGEDRGKAASVEVIQSTYAVYAGEFVSAYPQHLSDTETWQTRAFHHAGVDGGWEVVCQAPEDIWDDFQHLMTAMARTFAVDGELVFSGFSPVASQPDWQVESGDTILWMDKDGYVVDDAADEYICTRMMGWPAEKKALYTGQYRMSDLKWAGSYTCVPGKEYIDVFRTDVWYELAPGKESEVLLAGGMTVHEGWLHEGFATHVVVYHDGSAVETVEVLQTNDTAPGYDSYLSDLLANDTEVAQELNGEQLKACTDWFNDIENNGLLRFPYTTNIEVGLYMDLLFDDLGESESTFTDTERAALEQAGILTDGTVVKLTRAYVTSYLQEKMGFLETEAAQFLSDPGVSCLLGAYLKEQDAWYRNHGDTAYVPYTFDRGEFHPSLGGRVKLYYSAPRLSVADTDGLTNEPMVATLAPGEDGTWWMLSNLQQIYAK